MRLALITVTTVPLFSVYAVRKKTVQIVEKLVEAFGTTWASVGVPPLEGRHGAQPYRRDPFHVSRFVFRPLHRTL